MNSDETPVDASSPRSNPYEVPGYPAFLGRLQARFEEQSARGPLFTTDASGLWDAYLAALPEDRRKYHVCHCCRRFIENFGHLVTLDDAGHARSAFWDEHLAVAENAAAVQRLRERVEQAHVNGVFLSSQSVWGTPVTDLFHHLAVRVPQALVFQPTLLDAHQRMAELREHHRCLNVALGEFHAELLEQARTVLQANALFRSEKFIGGVEWLLARQRERAKPHGRNLMWKAVASAPAGFCTPRSSMIGTLLEDLAEGLPFALVKQKFDAKMHPLQYQRPQAAPSEGNVQQAEQVIARMGLARSLERRFATHADVEWTWKPKAPSRPEKPLGLFDHLRTKTGRAKELHLPEKTLTWVKFRDTVLPTAETMDVRVPDTSPAFSALVTAVHADAPPILQWDRPERRNPVSCYVYAHPTSARSWGLWPGDVEVMGLTTKPSSWFDNARAHHGQGIFFVLKDARDSRGNSLALFPEILRNELHGVRSTLEAYSQSRKLVVPEGEPLASGMIFTPSDGGTWNLRIRVKSQGHTADYLLDRWD